MQRTAHTTASLKRVEPYLPSNYTARTEDGITVIEGTDQGGYTLDGYVIPRLCSGLIGATEVEDKRPS